MNIEEAKKKIHNMAFRDIQTKPYDLKLADVMQVLNQIKLEQPKVVVPKFVADWYEKHKEGLWETVIDLIREDDAFEILSDMHKFGYTIQKEKLYTVDLPNGQPLVRGKNTLYFSQNLAAENARLTESEIRKDFDWAWQLAEEVRE